MSQHDFADLINRDASRLLANFNEVKEQRIIEGPPICIKADKDAFVAAYPHAVAILKKNIREQLKGQRYRVSEIKFKILEDAHKNFWGDYGRHYATVEIYDDLEKK